MQFGLLKRVGFVQRSLGGLVAVVAVAALLAPITRAETDTSTPKKAGIAFAKAVVAGDQAAVKANHEAVAEQVGMDILGAAAHVILLEFAHP